MLNAIIVAGATVLLMGQAYAEEYQSLVPDWTHTHKMEQDTEPSFFAYLDRLGESAISDRRKERVERYDQSWVDKRYWCEKKVTLNGRRNSVVFQELPTGKNFFAVTCSSGCENLKISVATNRNIVIGHSGLQYDFPHFWVPGPTTYLWDINVGFIVFDDGEDSSPDLVQKRTGRPSLSDETEVTIKHWRPHWMSSLMGKDCN